MKLRHDSVLETRKESCKDSAAKAAEILRASRLRQFFAAGALGVALFAAPAIVRAQQGPDGGVPAQPDATGVADAGTADAVPVSAPTPTLAPTPAPAAQTRLALPVAMSAAIDSNSHPANVTAPEVLTTNVLRMFQLRDLMGNPPAAPAEGQSASPERQAYDSAIRTWGSRDAAISAIDTALARGMRNLGRRAQTRESMGADADTLERRLTELDASIGSAGGTTIALEAAGNTVSCLLSVMRGDPPCAEREAPQDRESLAQPLHIIEMMPFNMNSEFFFTGFNAGAFVMGDPSSTVILDTMFGSNELAMRALQAMKDALEVLTNSPNDSAAQAIAAHALHDRLSAIPADREIWKTLIHPGFNNAMTALNQGDLRGGLTALRSDTAFNAAWSEFGCINQITLSQRAIARIRASFQLRIPDGTNPDEFVAFRRNTENRSYPWDVLYYQVGANYTNLVMSARLQSYSIDLNNFTITPSAPARAIDGDGHAVDGMAGITFGGTIFRQPIEATLMGRLGYAWYEFQAPDQEQRVLSLEDGTFYGMLDFNVAMVGYEGRNNAFRLSRWGLGIFNLNPYLNFTLTGRYFEGNHLRLGHSITPRYMLFWGRRREGYENPLFFQNRVGADWRPLDFTIQQGSGATWYFGPALGYTWNTEQGIHSFEPYVHGSLRWARGGLAVDARVGYITEVGGDEANRAPSSVTGMLNIILTPVEWFHGRSRTNSPAIDTERGGRI